MKMKAFSEKEKWASKGKKWLTSPCLLTESSTEANIIKSVIINVGNVLQLNLPFYLIRPFYLNFG